jgi:hypothetical protein
MSLLNKQVRKRILEDAESQSLSREELAFMLSEFDRVAQLEVPEADYSMQSIAQTHYEWHR